MESFFNPSVDEIVQDLRRRVYGAEFQASFFFFKPMSLTVTIAYRTFCSSSF